MKKFLIIWEDVYHTRKYYETEALGRKQAWDNLITLYNKDYLRTIDYIEDFEKKKVR